MKIRIDANGAHLFDRRTGMNALLDDLALPPSAWQTMPRFVSVALTNACDLACPFCYAPKHIASLNLESVVSWAHELDSGGCLGLGFGGGEPTLFPHFASLCKRISRETELAVSFTTHAHHVGKTLAAELSGYVHFIRVSMDGAYDTYSSIRGRPFSRLLDRLDIVKTIAPFGINFVVNSDTVAFLDDAAAIAFGKGAFEMLLLPEMPTIGREGIDEASAIILSDWVTRNNRYRLSISSAHQLDSISPATPFKDEDQLTAYAHIDASGYLKESSFSNKGIPIRKSLSQALDALKKPEMLE